MHFNDAIVEYFPLEKYVDKIILKPLVLEHLQDTSSDFKTYIKKISSYDDKYIIDYWIYLLYEELHYSQKIENMDFKEINLLNQSVFFNTLTISNKRIHELHNFAIKGEYEPTFEYRDSEVNVSRFKSDGKAQITGYYENNYERLYCYL